MKKVSIIIPVYNAESTLNRCLDSVITGTYENIEIICIDDDSSDWSAKIIKEYQKKDKRIHYYKNSKNSGPGISKNNGIKKATGDYLSFVDSDDYIEPDMIEKMLNFAVKNDLDIVRCNYTNYIDGVPHQANIPIDTGVFSTAIKDKFIKLLIEGKVPAYMQLIMIKADFIFKHELTIGDKYYLEDLLYYVRILNLTNRVGLLNMPLYNYINNQSGLTFSRDIDRIYKRIDGVLYYNKEAKHIIPKEKHAIDTYTMYLLILFMYELSQTSDKKIDVIKEIYNRSEVKNIANNINYDKYNTFTKVTYKLLKREHYYLVLCWFRFAKIIIYVKGKFRR